MMFRLPVVVVMMVVMMMMALLTVDGMSDLTAENSEGGFAFGGGANLSLSFFIGFVIFC